MGNASKKEFKHLELGTVEKFDIDGVKCIINPKLVLERKTTFKRKDGKWYYDDDDSKIAFSTKIPSHFLPNTSIVFDDNEKEVFAVTTTERSLENDVISVYCPKPCFDGQKATPDIYKGPQEREVPMYLTAIVEKKGVFHNIASAYMVVGVDDAGEVVKEEVYTAEKMKSMLFQAHVKSIDGNIVATLSQTNTFGGYEAEIVPKVDISLVILLASTCRNRYLPGPMASKSKTLNHYLPFVGFIVTGFGPDYILHTFFASI